MIQCFPELRIIPSHASSFRKEEEDCLHMIRGRGIMQLLDELIGIQLFESFLPVLHFLLLRALFAPKEFGRERVEIGNFPEPPGFADPIRQAHTYAPDSALFAAMAFAIATKSLILINSMLLVSACQNVGFFGALRRSRCSVSHAPIALVIVSTSVFNSCTRSMND